MLSAIRVLILEDEQADAELIVFQLRRSGYEPLWKRAETEAEYLACLKEEPCVILADYNLPQFDAPHALRLLQTLGLDIPFIVVSGTIGEEVAVAMMRDGASDYLLKDRLGRLGAAVAAALDRKRLREESRAAEEARRQAERRCRQIFETAVEGICQSDPMGNIIAVNPAFARIMGYDSPEEIIACVRYLANLYVEPERYADYQRRVDAGESQRDIECLLLKKDGSTIPVSMNDTVVRDGSGQVLHCNSTLLDITELKAKEAALTAYRHELQDLAARLLSAQETESRRLGREIHDAFSKRLAVLGIEVGLLRTKPPDSQTALVERLTRVGDNISELARGLSQMSRRLHPSILYDLGLCEALRHECAALTEGIDVRVSCHNTELWKHLPDDISLCLYRIAQESVWNSRKHSGAQDVLVSLGATDSHIVLAVEDDGRGFLREAVRGKRGLGLVSMEERVRQVGGQLTIDSTPGRGTRVEVCVAYNNPGFRNE